MKISENSSNDKIQEKFKEFLKENNAYYRFMENLYHSGKSESSLFSEIPGDWIRVAFFWGGINEGHDYWNKLNSKWTDKLYKKKKKINIISII